MKSNKRNRKKTIVWGLQRECIDPGLDQSSFHKLENRVLLLVTRTGKKAL